MNDETSTPQVDIKTLAHLARLDVSEEELKALEREVPSILAFVAQVSDVASDNDMRDAAHHNVMRDDVVQHEGDEHSEELLSQAPERSGRYVKVPQVIKKK